VITGDERKLELFFVLRVEPLLLVATGSSSEEEDDDDLVEGLVDFVTLRLLRLTCFGWGLAWRDALPGKYGRSLARVSGSCISL